MPYAVWCLSHATIEVVQLNVAMKGAAMHFESPPRDISNVAIWSGKGLRLPEVEDLCGYLVRVMVAALTHHRSVVVREEVRAMLGNMHRRYGVCGQIVVPSLAFAFHPGTTWIDIILQALGRQRTGLLIKSSLFACGHAHVPQLP